MAAPLFISGQTYKRSEIHDRYGGNRQAGISTTAKFPFIFIFTGKSGHQHGYKDQWENSNVFSYTGEGQVGDMKFTKGNLHLLEHVKTGSRVFLFTQEMKAFVKFDAELELEDFDFFQGPDKYGKERQSIKFFFRRKGIRLDYKSRQLSLSLAMGEDENQNINIPNETERQGLITSRVGQGAYRKSILYRWNFRCAVTNYSRNDILIASHIVPWKDATNQERLDVANGILLSPTYDALFDRHLISFENSGKIILSELLKSSNYSTIGVSGKEVIKSFSGDNYPYLEVHRNDLRHIEPIVV